MLTPAKILFAALVCAPLVASCATVSPPAPGPRPASWATPITTYAGLPNLNRVTATLYRSAQPTAEGFTFLSGGQSLVPNDQPIKTVLSLRAFNDDADVTPAASPLRLEKIRIKTWHPEREDVVKFLRVVSTPELQPVLLHCQHGSDRTGTMIAIYRIAVQGWTKEEATREMTGGGYGFHPMWGNLIKFINKLDIDSIKREVASEGNWK